jgi:hypothetical protein
LSHEVTCRECRGSIFCGRSQPQDILLSNRADGAPYKSANGFTAIYGHYGGAAITASGKLLAAWAEGERDYRTGTVWFNSVLVR